MINKVILIGNVGKDPDIYTFESGTKKATIRVVTTDRLIDHKTGEVRQQDEWHSVVAWRGHADFVDKYVRKGSQVYIEGSIHYRKWTSRDGIERNETEITVDDIRTLLGRRPQEQRPSVQQESIIDPPTVLADDEIMF